MTNVNSEAEKDILRFIVAMAQVRDDEDAVKQVIEDRLATVDPYLHASTLKVTLRVMVAQFYAIATSKLDEVLGYPLTDIAIEHQRCVNDGISYDDEESDEDLPPDRRLAVVPD